MLSERLIHATICSTKDMVERGIVPIELVTPEMFWKKVVPIIRELIPDDADDLEANREEVDLIIIATASNARRPQNARRRT